MKTYNEAITKKARDMIEKVMDGKKSRIFTGDIPFIYEVEAYKVYNDIIDEFEPMMIEFYDNVEAELT